MTSTIASLLVPARDTVGGLVPGPALHIPDILRTCEVPR
jgi:hypothetical protein